MTLFDQDAFSRTRERLVQRLLDEQQETGAWEGELATSALSTATAVTALHHIDAEANKDLIRGGLNWLAANANDDGGWGDTVLSFTNISTTVLCWAALNLRPEDTPELLEAEKNAETWIQNEAGACDPATVAKAIMARYETDHTFSVPILTMLSLCGRLGNDPWQYVTPLPFELAALPQKLYAWVRMPVVSYALPALIAIGQTIQHHKPTRNPITGLFRKLTAKSTLKILSSIQPDNGGFLEAIPLTSFVSMSLAAMGLRDHQVVQRGQAFIKSLTRTDGSWPIDTHLATWVTTLSINALNGTEVQHLNEERLKPALQWLLDQQYKQVHPYTGAAPGGWAWTPLPGGVPDADDTSGAVLALARASDNMQDPAPFRKSASAGLDWLAGLQNSDGGLPTFCRGWGTLPFDKSCPDITAHGLQAIAAWRSRNLDHNRWRRMAQSGLRYLENVQHDDGSWDPLWFGNQEAPGERNPTYGTARVLLGLQGWRTETGPEAKCDALISSGRNWLIANQNEDGGWGGCKGVTSSIEETALAVEALCRSVTGVKPSERDVIAFGLSYLIEATEEGAQTPPAAIGFYFANLWYFEQLYPHIFATGAFEAAAPLFHSSATPES